MSLQHNKETSIISKKRRAVAKWLLLGVLMILVQIILGGITRLTGSGLSITEWKPILGAVPPMNDQEWQAAFELYKVKAAGQFINHNSNYTLSDFKAIYFWEWLHREWARLLGVVFLIGFGFFAWRKYFDKKMLQPFIILFVLGALQGAVGWIMVASGLNPDDTHVSHIKLALHFMFALVLLCYTFWFALKLLVQDSQTIQNNKLQKLLTVTLVLLGVQLVYGAFMAGLKAAPVAATWPDVNGSYLPEKLNQFGAQVYSGLQVITDNPISVHYIHRTIAYLLFVLVVALYFEARKWTKTTRGSLLAKGEALSLVLISLQILLGIITVLNGHLMTQNKFLRFELFALLHQLVAVLLLLNLVFNYYLVKKRVKTD